MTQGQVHRGEDFPCHISDDGLGVVGPAKHLDRFLLVKPTRFDVYDDHPDQRILSRQFEEFLERREDQDVLACRQAIGCAHTRA